MKQTMKDRQLLQAMTDRIPFSVTVDGVRHDGIPADAKYTRDGYRFELEGLLVSVQIRTYDDFPVTEWRAEITNVSDTVSGRVSGLIPADAYFPGEDAVLEYSNGDNCTPSGYSIFYSDLKEPVKLCPPDGTSCNGAFPYMRLQWDDHGAAIAIGYSGQWEAEISKADGGVIFKAAQHVLDTVLYPGEKIISPRITVMAYEGDTERGINLWRSFYRAHIMPRPGGEPMKPYLVLHQFGEGPEACRATEELQLRSIDTYIKRGLKPDIWWIDAGWYPCDNYWPTTGTWYENPENWPNGLGPVGEKCDENGIKFLLWFEPERVADGSWLAENHPEWLLRPNDGEPTIYNMLDLGDPRALSWLTEHVDAMIKRCHIKIYRQDFNFSPIVNWRRAETEDRQGMVENKCIQGYYAYWDELLRRNPDIFIDSCASGGRRNDLETMRRAVPLHYTDVLYGVHPVKQKQHRLMFEWIPYFRAHNMSWDNESGTYDPPASRPLDEFAYMNAMVPAMTNMLNATDDDGQFTLAIKMNAIHKKAAEYMLDGDYYPLTECRADEHDVYAHQFDLHGEGFTQIIYNTKAEGPFTLRLKHLDAEADYALTDAVTGQTFTVPGKTLSDGYAIKLAPRSSKIYFYKKA